MFNGGRKGEARESEWGSRSTVGILFSTLNNKLRTAADRRNLTYYGTQRIAMDSNGADTHVISAQCLGKGQRMDLSALVIVLRLSETCFEKSWTHERTQRSSCCA